MRRLIPLTGTSQTPPATALARACAGQRHERSLLRGHGPASCPAMEGLPSDDSRRASWHASGVTETRSRPASERPPVPTTEDAGVDIAQMALAMHDLAPVPATVERVLNFALAAVDCSHAAVVFVRPRRRLEVVASTHPAIEDLIATEMQSGKGPVLAMVTNG